MLFCLFVVLFVCVLVSVAFLQAREKVWHTHSSRWLSVALDRQSREKPNVLSASSFYVHGDQLAKWIWMKNVSGSKHQPSPHTNSKNFRFYCFANRPPHPSLGPLQIFIRVQ
ncbi:MAG: hypothetical protein JOS17DRAFT_742668 [Linnemannia elongata]|nr:MAG: hypothetical protein JOS17DRAFT_742668 [Linnemannia elongata]